MTDFIATLPGLTVVRNADGDGGCAVALLRFGDGAAGELSALFSQRERWDLAAGSRFSWAGKLAAKCATAALLGARDGRLRWVEVEVLPDPGSCRHGDGTACGARHAPALRLHGAARRAAHRLGWRLTVSISHESTAAAALVAATAAG